MTDAIPNVTAIPRHGEWYIVLWYEHHRRDVLQQFGRWASNPELSFTWNDAAKAASNIAEATRDNYTGV